MVAFDEGQPATSGFARLRGLRLGYGTKDFNVSAATTNSRNTLTTAGKFRDTSVGGSATFGGLWLSAARRDFKLDAARQSLWMLGASYSVGLHEFKASWLRNDLQGQVRTTSINANDATQIGLGYVYNLSKRTAWYATLAHIDNRGAARYLMSDGPTTVNAGGASRGHEVGLRHRF